MRSLRGEPLRIGGFWVGVECGQRWYRWRSWRRRPRYELHVGECGWVRRFGPIMWWPERGGA